MADPQTDQPIGTPTVARVLRHLFGAVTSDALRADGHRACCPDCMTTVERYRAMRDGASSTTFDPTTTPYAGDPRQR